MPEPDLHYLQAKAAWLWCETLRLHLLAPEVRIASCLSAVEMLTALFYGGYLHLQPSRPAAPERDRFIPSKGHGSLSLYPIMADLGYCQPSELARISCTDSRVSPIPGPGLGVYETVNGSLGHGLGVGAGMALALRQKKLPARVIVLHGDGELSEGAVWEAVMFAGQHRLDQLLLLIDANGKSMLGKCRDIISCDHLPERFQSFGWQVMACPGHDLAALSCAYRHLFNSRSRKPKVLIARTSKGHGVPELENSDLCHVLSLSASRCRELLQERGIEETAP